MSGSLRAIIITHSICVKCKWIFFGLNSALFCLNPLAYAVQEAKSHQKVDKRAEFCWFVRNVRAAMLVIKNKSISLLWELNSIFSCKFFEVKLYCIDPRHGRLVTWSQTKNRPFHSRGQHLYFILLEQKKAFTY